MLSIDWFTRLLRLEDRAALQDWVGGVNGEGEVKRNEIAFTRADQVLTGLEDGIGSFVYY